MVRWSSAGSAAGASAGRATPKVLAEALEHVLVAGLVERDADRVGVDEPQVQALAERLRHELLGAAGRSDRERVEEGVVPRLEAGGAEARGQASGAGVHLLGDVPEPLGAVVHGVHRRDDRQEHLRGADVRGRLLAPDVLLTGLQGQAVGGATGGVHRHADEAARHGPTQRVARGEEARVRAAVAERHAEPL